MKYISVILFVIFAPSIFAQTPAWTNTYGGYLDEQANDIIEIFNGTFMMAGYTKSDGAGGSDGFMVNINSSGDSLGAKMFGGASDDCFEAIVDAGNGLLLAGHTASYGAGDYDWWIVKTNYSGDTLWTKTYGTSGDDKCYDVCKVSSGGLAFIGYRYDTYSNVWLIRTDDAGDTLWTGTYGGSFDDIAYSIKETSDRGFLIGAKTQSYGSGGWDMWVIKTDSLGNVDWSETFGGAVNEICYDVMETSDGGYLATGTGNSYGAGYYDFYTVKLNSSGDSLWMDIWGDIGYDYAYACAEDAAGQYIIGGQLSFDMCYRILSQDGDSIETAVFEAALTQWCKAMAEEGDEMILAGSTNGEGNGAHDFYALKTQGLSGIQQEQPHEGLSIANITNGRLSLYSKSDMSVDLTIYNVNGSKVYANNIMLRAGDNGIDISHLKTGIYYVKTTLLNSSQHTRIMLIK